MFGIGFMELAVVALGVLLFVGPKRLPEVARQAGKMFVKMRRVTNEVKSNFDTAMRQVEEEVVAEEREKLRKLLEVESKEIKAHATVDLGTEPADPHHEGHSNNSLEDTGESNKPEKT